MDLQFSIIIPVYNRPQEINELLNSCIHQTFLNDFEIIIVEDGSTNKCEDIVDKYKSQLTINYFFKENSGAGASRNFGMQQATGNYFIILDSDVLLPTHYLEEVYQILQNNYTDVFGGPDAAHESFSTIQKAINYSMTSVLTTGGIRGKKKAVGKFQPRSFNMGISKKAFFASKGFSKMQYGEDIDLSLRLLELGFESQLISKAFVYHKRRSTVKQFLNQTYHFGTARPVLNKKYPSTAKLAYWFPTLFMMGFFTALVIAAFGCWFLGVAFAFYFSLIFIDSSLQNKNIKVGLVSILTTFIQFLGYGSGFLNSYLKNQSL